MKENDNSSRDASTPWYRKNSFHWRGRKNGVDQWQGSPKGPLRVLGWVFAVYGIIAGIVALAFLPALFSRDYKLWPVFFVFAIHFLVFGLTGWWAIRFRRKLSRLKSGRELAEDLGVSLSEIERVAEAHRIKAAVNINDVDLYDPDLFISARVLLRAASPPDDSGSLLRAAHSRTSTTSEASLLRPSSSEEAGESSEASSAGSGAADTTERADAYHAAAHAAPDATEQINPLNGR